jgi:hypothetical protein
MPSSPRANHTTSRDNSLTTASKMFHVGEGRFGAVPLGWLLHLRGRTLVVYVALAAHVDPSGYCYPSKKTLMEVSGIRKDHIREALRELEEIGAIKTEQRFRQSSRYRLMPPLVEGTQLGASEGTQIGDRGDLIQGGEGTQIGDRGDLIQGGEGTQIGDRGEHVLGPHNRPRNIVFNKTSRACARTKARDADGKEKTNDEGRTSLIPVNEIAESFFAQHRARFGIKNPPSPSKATP